MRIILDSVFDFISFDGIGVGMQTIPIFDVLLDFGSFQKNKLLFFLLSKNSACRLISDSIRFSFFNL